MARKINIKSLDRRLVKLAARLLAHRRGTHHFDQLVRVLRQEISALSTRIDRIEANQEGERLLRIDRYGVQEKRYFVRTP
jgi:hypothetical protein